MLRMKSAIFFVPQVQWRGELLQGEHFTSKKGSTNSPGWAFWICPGIKLSRMTPLSGRVPGGILVAMLVST